TEWSGPVQTQPRPPARGYDDDPLTGLLTDAVLVAYGELAAVGQQIGGRLPSQRALPLRGVVDLHLTDETAAHRLEAHARLAAVAGLAPLRQHCGELVGSARQRLRGGCAGVVGAGV